MPEHLVAAILDGELHTHPRPVPRHAVAISSLTESFVGPFGKGRGSPGGWWIIGGPEVHLGAQVLVPELAGCAGSACQTFWRRRGSTQPPIGSARSSRPRPPEPIGC